MGQVGHTFTSLILTSLIMVVQKKGYPHDCTRLAYTKNVDCSG